MKLDGELTDVIIIGGGLAGLINALQLAKAGLNVILLEQKKYPFHKVCGEYVSNEVIPFLRSIDAYPEHFQPASIKRFHLTSVKGKLTEMPLDLGGFGISRYLLDHFLFQKAKHHGATIKKARVEQVKWLENHHFQVQLKGGEIMEAPLVIGAYGKRTKLDKHLDREFIKKRSDYMAVKYHITTDFPTDLIALHNFAGGYCGISSIENGRYNLCYLSQRDHLRKYGNIVQMEQAVLWENPFLREIFNNADFLFDKPLAINEISFEQKQLIVDHVFMCGDAAGLITPLCGNGMAMAIHAAVILSELIKKYFFRLEKQREMLEKEYEETWSRFFARRLWVGRHTQRLFGSSSTSEMAVWLANLSPSLAQKIMKHTHGQPF
ncbi:MAG: FAD-dependent oxidoreductase [Candidatus Cyclobacteriaceae bacterium M3_2C_046]